MVEYHRYAARSGEERYTISNCQRIRVVHLKPVAIYHRYRKWSKRSAVLKRSDRGVESVPVHHVLPHVGLPEHLLYLTPGPTQVQPTRDERPFDTRDEKKRHR